MTANVNAVYINVHQHLKARIHAMTEHDNHIILIVKGTPRPKQSFRYSRRGNYQPERVKAWQEAVAWQARVAMRDLLPLEGPVSMRCVFVLPNNRRVDLDNLNKAVMDALNGIAYLDDNQVVNLHLVKHVRPTPGVMIEIYPGGVLPMMEAK